MKNLQAPGKSDKLSVNLNAMVQADHSYKPPRRQVRVRTSCPEDGDLGPFPLQQLLRIARQSGITDTLASTTSLNLLTSSRAVRLSLLRVLKPLGMSQTKFFTLVSLYALDPVHLRSADLAYYVELTRPAMTGILDTLEKCGWIRRERRVDADRRAVLCSLTDEGREATVFAIYRFLKVAAEISEELNPAQHKQLAKLCLHMGRRSLDLER